MWLSIQGMYEYDHSIMDGLNVPSGISKTDVINNIMLKCSELEIIYPDFDILKLAITTWSNSEFNIWQKLYDTMIVNYNPIWNVDANITITDHDETEDSRTIKDNSDRNNDITSENTDTTSVKGFNETAWQEHEKTASGGTSNEVESYTNTRKDDYNSEKSGTHTERRTGNIGVTATQDLIKKEREIAEFNIIDYITDSFKKRFCLLVY